MLALTEKWSSELKQVFEEAVRLAEKPWYVRFLRSKQNAKKFAVCDDEEATICRLCNDIAEDAIQSKCRHIFVGKVWDMSSSVV